VPKLPRVTSKQVLRALKGGGFVIDHITGSHYIMYKDNNSVPVSVPFHNKIIKGINPIFTPRLGNVKANAFTFLSPAS